MLTTLDARRLGTWLCALLLLAATACGEEPSEEGPDHSGPRLVAFVPVQHPARTPGVEPGAAVRIERTADLRRLAPASAYPGGRLPRLDAVDEDRERIAALVSGCQEKVAPELSRDGEGWTARFADDDNGVVCARAEHYVAVWDVPF